MISRTPHKRGLLGFGKGPRSLCAVLVDLLDALLEYVEALREQLLGHVQRRYVSHDGLAAREKHQALLERELGDLVPARGRILLRLSVLDELVREHHAEASRVAD